MVNTGGKSSSEKLGSLTLSVDQLVHRYSSKPKTASTLFSTTSNSYASRLKREHQKVLGHPFESDPDHPDRFIDPPTTSVLKLETDQILQTGIAKKQLWKGTDTTATVTETAPIKDDLTTEQSETSDQYIIPVKTDTSPDVDNIFHEDPETPKYNNVPSQTVAPRALPFSEETHVLVKIIAHDSDLSSPSFNPDKTENIRWMQRDAIKHYLCIQDIEKRRAATKGAVYRSFQHDA
jgi:hypothetical protein